MRRRWRWQGDALMPVLVVAMTWFVAGGVTIVVISKTTKDEHGHTTATGWLALAIWLAPMVIAVLVALVRALVILWRDPPLRRVTEPVLEDLRDERDR